MLEIQERAQLTLRILKLQTYWSSETDMWYRKGSATTKLHLEENFRSTRLRDLTKRPNELENFNTEKYSHGKVT